WGPAWFLLERQTAARPKRARVGTGFEGQTRTFTRDNRGFLTQECHPELGAGGNGCISYSGHRADGQATTKQEGGRTLSSIYDFAGRLRKLSSSADSVVSEWHYDGGNGFGGGKVHRTVRRQSVRFPGQPTFRVVVEELFHYTGPGGAPTT